MLDQQQLMLLKTLILSGLLSLTERLENKSPCSSRNHNNRNCKRQIHRQTEPERIIFEYKQAKYYSLRYCCTSSVYLDSLKDGILES